jgi:hypothetical protein
VAKCIKEPKNVALIKKLKSVIPIKRKGKHIEDKSNKIK